MSTQDFTMDQNMNLAESNTITPETLNSSGSTESASIFRPVPLHPLAMINNTQLISGNQSPALPFGMLPPLQNLPMLNPQLPWFSCPLMPSLNSSNITTPLMPFNPWLLGLGLNFSGPAGFNLSNLNCATLDNSMLQQVSNMVPSSVLLPQMPPVPTAPTQSNVAPESRSLPMLNPQIPWFSCPLMPSLNSPNITTPLMPFNPWLLDNSMLQQVSNTVPSSLLLSQMPPVPTAPAQSNVAPESQVLSTLDQAKNSSADDLSQEAQHPASAMATSSDVPQERPISMDRTECERENISVNVPEK
ncbi:unnamed protein product, partial [Strongylus vulgaris]